MSDTEPKYARGTVWWCNLPTRLETNIQGGKRPVVVISSDRRGGKSTCFEVLAMTTAPRAKMVVNVPAKVGGKSNTILATQHFTVDEKDMESYICTLSAVEMANVEKAILFAQGMEKYMQHPTTTTGHDTYATMDDDTVRSQLAVAYAELKVYKQQNDALISKLDLTHFADAQKQIVDRDNVIKSKDIEIAVLQERLRVSEARLSYFTDLVIGHGVLGIQKSKDAEIKMIDAEKGTDNANVEAEGEILEAKTEEHETKTDDTSEQFEQEEKSEGISEEVTDVEAVTPKQEEKIEVVSEEVDNGKEETEGNVEVVTPVVSDIEDKIEKLLEDSRRKGFKSAGFWDDDDVKRAFIKDYEEKSISYVLERWGLTSKHSASQTRYSLKKKLDGKK